MRSGRAIYVLFIGMLAGCSTQQLQDFHTFLHEPVAFGKPAAAERPIEPAVCKPAATVLTLTPGQRALTIGVWMYEDGDYARSETYLMNALSQEISDADRIKAHKYLAFILCADNRQIACRAEFREALAINPKFELDVSEEGHPLWGPVFRSLRATAAGR
ncbi:MAG TPA: TssQ family T6SS-associated lipoprotein [Burkholderiales bacterium]|nr:TssQ family T6SS-associated lipoprotein [Burkholderiales bacterium]